jgi:hypothetical protein
MRKRRFASAATAVFIGFGGSMAGASLAWADGMFSMMNPFEWFDDDDDDYWRYRRWAGPYGYGGGPYGWGGPSPYGYGWGGGPYGYGWNPYSWAGGAYGWGSYGYGAGTSASSEKSPPPAPPKPE